jgi:hypothetical protein
MKQYAESNKSEDCLIYDGPKDVLLFDFLDAITGFKPNRSDTIEILKILENFKVCKYKNVRDQMFIPLDLSIDLIMENFLQIIDYVTNCDVADDTISMGQKGIKEFVKIIDKLEDSHIMKDLAYRWKQNNYFSSSDSSSEHISSEDCSYDDE